MPVLIIDGPEAGGKSTVIGHLFARLRQDATLRYWGPVDSWHDYALPLSMDLTRTDGRLVVWSRSWASEVVYDELLSRGQNPSEWEIEKTLEWRVRECNGYMLMIMADPDVLTARRAARRGVGRTDLPVGPEAEAIRFGRYAAEHEWDVVRGDRPTKDTVDAVIARLGLRA